MTKKILYVGSLFPGATCLGRLESLRAIGHLVHGVNTRAHVDRARRVMRSIAARLHLGPLVNAINSEVTSAHETFGVADVVWVDKGVWIWPDTIKRLRQIHPGALFVHFTPDPQLVYHRSRHFIASLPYYDIVVTTKRYELELYRSAGAKRIVFCEQSADDTFLYPTDDMPCHDIVFVGHCEPYYVDCVRALVRAGHEVKVFGHGWAKACARDSMLSSAFGGHGQYHHAYRQALRSGRICLGLLTKLAPDTTTTRSFEIPAVGSFMLSEYTSEIGAIFEERVHAGFFRSLEDLLEQAAWFLANSNTREEIASRGYERFRQGRHSTFERISDLWNTLYTGG